MDVFKIAVKVFTSQSNLPPEQFVPIFHHWIQNHSVEGHRLIDVADYGHVVNGPGTVLVSSEANFYMDSSEGRLGILYSRKLPIPGTTFQDRLRICISEALKSAERLEKEPAAQGKLKFKTDEVLVRLNDRLLAPPTDQTVSDHQDDVQAVAKKLFGESVQVESKFSPQTLVEFRLQNKAAPALANLISAMA
jgi:hypothetical protein